MSLYREGYEYYVLKCLEFELDPIDFAYFVEKLSREQLEVFNVKAKQMKGWV